MINGEKHNKFVVVAPMFNASATIEKFLHSLYGQSYDNWSVVLIDDVSEKNHSIKCNEIINKFNSNFGDKVSVIWNDEKCWEVANVLKGIKTCDSDDIVCRIDADDWLTDLDAFYILNGSYNQSNAGAIWSSHRWGYTNQNISGPMPENVDVYAYPWVSSHLKTFRKQLIENINDENFRGEDGNYIKRAGDQCIYLPVLHNAKVKGHIPMCLYHYSIKTDDPSIFQTHDAKFQKSEAEFLRKRGYVK
jgi:glycosyltransferase involved in cell wall biosynthesis